MTSSKEDIAKAVQKTISSHGYGFQYRIVRTAHELWDSEVSPWVFYVSEFPVRVQGGDTRIDFILRLDERAEWYANFPVFLVAECKRANPALSRWCFVKAPYVQRKRTRERLFLDEVEVMHGGHLRARAVRHPPLSDTAVYHIPFEVRTGKNGDCGGPGRGAIENAATQVFRGVNGLIERFREDYGLLTTAKKAVLIPVVFTTARLFVSDVDISESDLKTGNIEVKPQEIEEKPWVCFQYPVSLGLKHTIHPTLAYEDLGELLDEEHLRTLFIVNGRGTEDFLTHLYLDLDSLERA
jgi:hypothetical protein